MRLHFLLQKEGRLVLLDRLLKGKAVPSHFSRDLFKSGTFPCYFVSYAWHLWDVKVFCSSSDDARRDSYSLFKVVSL